MGHTTSSHSFSFSSEIKSPRLFKVLLFALLAFSPSKLSAQGMDGKLAMLVSDFLFFLM